MSKIRNYGSGGGMSKHRKSGKAPKSPKLRHQLMLDAQKNERKAPPPLPFDTVEEVFKSPSKKVKQ